MVTRSKQNEQLLSVLRARCEQARAVFQGVCQQITKTNQIVEKLKSTSEAPEGDYKALGADVLYLKWVERRRTAIMYQLAQLHAEREDAAQKLRKANGRAKAFEAVLEAQERAHKLLDGRKAEAKVNALLVSQKLSGRF